MTRSKELVSYSWKPLSPEASIFPPPHTHTHTHTTSYANIGNLLYIRVQTNPSVPYVLLGGLARDCPGISCSHCDDQTPGLRGSCLSHSLSPSRLRLFNLLLLLRLRLLLRRRLFDLFRLLLRAQLSSALQSTLVLEQPRS